VYIIESGMIKLARSFPDGRELILALVRPQQLIGVISVILQRPYPVTATTITRCNLRCVPADDFRHLLKTNHDFSWQVLESQSRDILRQVEHLSELGCLSARHRLEHFLWEWASSAQQTESQAEVRLQMPVKQWEMAQLLAVTSPYVSRMLDELEREGVLRREKGWLVVTNPCALWHL
jgi:CRP-like cAMP-binding protein